MLTIMGCICLVYLKLVLYLFVAVDQYGIYRFHNAFEKEK